MSLHIGIARADITPPIGIPMVGFAGRDRSNAVHDPLTATALVAAEDENRAVLICTDLLFVEDTTIAEYRRAIAAATGIESDHVTISCAHNHYGPDVDRSAGLDIVDAYRENLKHLLVGIVSQAQQSLQPARMGIGWGESDIGINRRERKPDGSIVLGHNPDGPVDRQVCVVRFEEVDGSPLVALVNFACHPVCQASQMRALSADYPGRMRQVVESLTGAPCLFLQGAGANINPILMEHSYEPARTLGTRLGCEAVKVWETIEVEEMSGLRVVSTIVSLPRYRYGSAENAEQLVRNLEKEVERRKAQENSASSLWWAQSRLKRAQEVLESWQADAPLPTIDAELQAWKLGDLALTTAPGEIFNEIGSRVKRDSPLAHTCFAAYTNGSIGYVPVREAYSEGGYEVTHACRVDPEAGDLVHEGCLELLRSLAD